MTIRVNPASNVAADFNEDGLVNAADVAVVAGGLGIASGADKAAGDANGDGRVDLDDLLAVQRAFGEGEGSERSAAAVVARRRADMRLDAAGATLFPSQFESIRATRRAAGR